jgi:hypothetical protein
MKGLTFYLFFSLLLLSILSSQIPYPTKKYFDCIYKCTKKGIELKSCFQDKECKKKIHHHRFNNAIFSDENKKAVSEENHHHHHHHNKALSEEKSVCFKCQGSFIKKKKN